MNILNSPNREKEASCGKLLPSSIFAPMTKYYWILNHLSLLLLQLKHSFICKGVIGQNADIHKFLMKIL